MQNADSTAEDRDSSISNLGWTTKLDAKAHYRRELYAEVWCFLKDPNNSAGFGWDIDAWVLYFCWGLAVLIDFGGDLVDWAVYFCLRPSE